MDIFDTPLDGPAERVISANVEREDDGIIGMITGFMLKDSTDSPMIIRLRRWDRSHGIAKEVEITIDDNLNLRHFRTYYS